MMSSSAAGTSSDELHTAATSLNDTSHATLIGNKNRQPCSRPLQPLLPGVTGPVALTLAAWLQCAACDGLQHRLLVTSLFKSSTVL
jgi:hypothetical protein